MTHRQGRVSEVLLNEQGGISALKLDSTEVVEADFFVDSTGWRQALIPRNRQAESLDELVPQFPCGRL